MNWTQNLKDFETLRLKQIEFQKQYQMLSFSAWWKYHKPAHYDLPPHVKFLCKVVDDVVAGRLQNVAISLPPGHGKSDTISRRLPVYWAQRNPMDAVVFTGYNQTFAEKQLSKPARDFAEELGILDTSTTAMSDWQLTNGGRLVARGVGSAPTGINPISLLVCDDPIKDRMQAESQIERDNIWDWWTGSIVQRFFPRTKALVICTRWHHDDLIGRLQKENNGTWTFINLPAIAEEGDVLGRTPGTALWESVKPLAFLEQVRAQMGDYNFNALFQGNPTPREGALFKVGNLHFVDASDLPPMVERVRRWDIASSSGKGDFTVGALMGKDSSGRFYVLDIVRGQLGTDDRNNVMVQTAQQDGTGVRIVVPQDPGSAGKDQSLQFTRLLSGYNVRAVRETGSKTVRADGFASQVNAGNVAVVRGHWNNAWVEEHRVFDKGAHDDQVDATSGAFNELASVSNVWDW